MYDPKTYLSAEIRGKLLAKYVKKVSENQYFIEFTIRDETIWIYKNGKKPKCTCPFGSIWGINKPFSSCWHVFAVTEYMKNESRRKKDKK